MCETATQKALPGRGCSSEINGYMYASSLVAWSPSITHSESVSLLEFVWGIRPSWMPPGLPLNYIICFVLREANCLLFALCFLV